MYINPPSFNFETASSISFFVWIIYSSSPLTILLLPKSFFEKPEATKAEIAEFIKN